MLQNVQHLFRLSAAAILTITGAAKVWSAFGSAGILKNIDPILGLQFGRFIFSVGVLEFVVAGVCLLASPQIISAGIIAWFATILLVYRLGLWWIGWHRPCSCLGNLTDAIHIPPQTADTAMKIILAYLLIGSYGTLFWLWRQSINIRLFPLNPISQLPTHKFMPTDNIPAADTDFHKWVVLFSDYVNTNAAAMGLTPEDVAPLTAAVDTWNTAFPAHTAACLRHRRHRQQGPGARRH